uniref:Uncharacterized protein n=1 Tax=Aureoumbra lagunensis TaxID=44058 RepID=A0A7S3JNG7_9STRA|mmetsp:Transcript_22901/g.29659  ORF Transcript_22901/g.29659 Transcript_22901/m.29659 type:complete len:251 (+) Transcript_22901:642-1394(+)|eukprot:CAMPEP_0197301338 /NCGR_PEP_ID=MMETSP0890-20130614/50341_1 /TAXON_ID=44058 ORGANISM="Aureoumbra lagunensis, Strain CCMP1510" /NCGR_SAMPLE_ID=MMETSP0890 /ASSEMBLY_ACC=CAM_ASM_000533 /LENGTH=250 /DNA_ID=CAMNT_0042780623 /DNA_START=575 /DNA_END=1327 /DNA_ORIENTATION=-
MGSRALSAPELSRVSDKTTTPQKPHSPLSEVYSPVKEELKNASVSFANGASQEKKKSGALLAAPTLSAGAMLGGGNSGTSTTRNSSSARRALARKPRGLGARRLDGDVIMTQDPPPRSATPPTPPPANSRLAALNAEINAPSPPPTNVPTAPSPVITNRQSNREPIAINQQQEQSSITARFADKKGFGSDAFFDREDSPPSNNDGRPSASRFAGQSGIGSDAFFDDQKSGVDVTTQLKGVLSSTLDRFVR